MELHKFFSMTGGEGEASYAKNSSHQRMILREVKPTLDNCIEELIRDMMDGVSNNCIKVADLGCSSGPNAIVTMQQIIESIDKVYQIANQEPPVIQYFLNDLFSNDFNIVFKRLPIFYEKLQKENGRLYTSCLVAAMPGSFYNKLFPAPRELTTESEIPVINKGSIYCGKTSPAIVQQAYRNQFAQDFSMFLKQRSEEMVQNGHLLLTFLSENSDDIHGTTHHLHLMGMALVDLVNEGYIEEAKLDSFNLPVYMPSVEETKQIIEEEGSFKIQRLKAFKTRMDASFESTTTHEDEDDDDDSFDRAKYVATYLRSVYETLLVRHFGEAIMDDLFSRFAKKLVNDLQMGRGPYTTMVISLRKIN